MEKFIQKVTTPPRILPLRLFKSMWQQKRKTPICPNQPRLDGNLALVTGGNGGIGFETSKGLAQRGADVIILARNEAKSRAAIERIRDEVGAETHFVGLDLADLESVNRTTTELARRWPNRKIDIVVANAGIIPTTYSKSAQGHESSFAINVLGHHVLLRRCINQSLLTKNARVVVLTGDIYIMENECTPDYNYENGRGNQKAYCRSKLGNIWWAQELFQHYPSLCVTTVHPGVVASDLGGQAQTSGFAGLIRNAILLSPEAGAQTSLICATQSDLVAGGYYHNTMGQVIFHQDDPAADSKKAGEFWQLLEELSLQYID